MTDINDQLEPGVMPLSAHIGECAALSQAISLKRIADALEQMVPPVVTTTTADGVTLIFERPKTPGWPEGMTRGGLDDIRSGKARPASTHKATSTVVTSQEPPVQPVPASVASPPPDDEEDET